MSRNLNSAAQNSVFQNNVGHNTGQTDTMPPYSVLSDTIDCSLVNLFLFLQFSKIYLIFTPSTYP